MAMVINASYLNEPLQIDFLVAKDFFLRLKKFETRLIGGKQGPFWIKFYEFSRPSPLLLFVRRLIIFLAAGIWRATRSCENAWPLCQHHSINFKN